MCAHTHISISYKYFTHYICTDGHDTHRITHCLHNILHTHTQTHTHTHTHTHLYKLQILYTLHIHRWTWHRVTHCLHNILHTHTHTHTTIQSWIAHYIRSISEAFNLTEICFAFFEHLWLSKLTATLAQALQQFQYQQDGAPWLTSDIHGFVLTHSYMNSECFN